MRAKDLKESYIAYGDFNSKIFIHYLKNKIEKQLRTSANILRNYADLIEEQELKSLSAFNSSILNAIQTIQSLIGRAKQLDEGTRREMDRFAGDLETFKDQLEVILQDVSRRYQAIDRVEYKRLVKELYQSLLKVDKATTAVVTEIDAILDPVIKPIGMFGKLKGAFG